MLNEAAADEDVVSIKITLYRVARSSKIVEALIEAAENGKLEYYTQIVSMPKMAGRLMSELRLIP